MSRTTYLAIAAAVCTGFTATLSQYDFTSDRLFSDGQNSVTGLGVCQATESQISCWDMDGKPDPSLVKLAENPFRYGNDVPMRVGLKNRIIVVSHTANIGVRPDTGSIRLLPIISGATRVDLLVGAFDPTQATASVVATLWDWKPVSADVPMRKGATATAAGVHLTLFGWQEPESSSVFSVPEGEKRWRIVFSWDRPRDSHFRPEIQYFSKAGERVWSIDKKGQPIPNRETDLRWQREHPKSVRQQAIPIALDERITDQSYSFVTNVNPDGVSKIRVVMREQKTALVTGFPLDPKE